MSKKRRVDVHPCPLSLLCPGDVVFDVGAYRGNSTAELADLPVQVHAFEPAPEACAVLQKRFEDRENVYVHAFGLGDKSVSIPFGDALRDGGSFLSELQPVIVAPMMDIVEFCRDNSIEDIACMCINIEGGEFQLLPHIISSGLITAVQSLTIYWHYVISDAGCKHQVIERDLSQTHRKVRCSVHTARDIYIRKDQSMEGGGK